MNFQRAIDKICDHNRTRLIHGMAERFGIEKFPEHIQSFHINNIVYFSIEPLDMSGFHADIRGFFKASGLTD